MARKILLADDSVTAQNMGRKILVDAGYDVLTVNNGSAALKRITETKPDLIILDVYMPGYSGLEVCQRLKDAAETANIPVLLSVGKLEPFKPQDARRVRADAHIVKPFEASELLSAIAKLEDVIVPQAHKPAFCSPLPDADRFDDESYTKPERGSGRKNGRGSSKKKESEAQTEDAVANFRDFRKAKGKSAEAGASPAETFAVQDAAAVPDIPRDITTEELDALSAVAAKLDAPAAEKAPLPTEVAGSPAESTHVSAQRADATVASDSEKATAATIASAADVPAETPRTVMPEETPAAQVQPASEVATVGRAEPIEVRAAAPQTTEPQGLEPQTVEAKTTEPQPVEFKATEFPVKPEVTPEPVNAGSLVQEPAPVDRQDEPMFASASAEETISPKVEAQPSHIPVPVEAQKAEVQNESVEEEKSAKEKPAPVEAAPAVPIIAKVEEAVEPEAPAPTAEELAEALRLLTPATGYGEAASDGMSMAGGAAVTVSAQSAGASLTHLTSEEAGSGSSARRWMAQVVALSPEEATLSLEEEMFKTFAAAPAGEAEAAPATNRVSMITAAVENRLAEVAKQAEPAAEEAPKAMAAAAATESSAPADSTTGSEEGAIANIVDKVLADLRPKIVEEIAKKLGKNG